MGCRCSRRCTCCKARKRCASASPTEASPSAPCTARNRTFRLSSWKLCGVSEPRHALGRRFGKTPTCCRCSGFGSASISRYALRTDLAGAAAFSAPPSAHGFDGKGGNARCGQALPCPARARSPRTRSCLPACWTIRALRACELPDRTTTAASADLVPLRCIVLRFLRDAAAVCEASMHHHARADLAAIHAMPTDPTPRCAFSHLSSQCSPNDSATRSQGTAGRSSGCSLAARRRAPASHP